MIDPPPHVQPVTGLLHPASHPPSPLLTPSSQVSVATFQESPQIAVQTEVPLANVAQVHPGSTKQKASHPSRFIRLKSSHPSSGVLYPSPQTVAQVEAVFTSPPVHVYPQAGPLH